VLKQTPLNAEHRASGARMVDFGGWEMPVNYGSQLDEHHAVRRDAGMFDVSHMRVVDIGAVSNADGNHNAREFLRYALANDVDKLQEHGRALYSCLLNPAGGILDDLIVYAVREDSFRIVLNAATADRDIEWLRKLQGERAAGPTLTPRADLAIIAVQGPNARVKVWQAIPGSKDASSALKPFTSAEANTALGEIFIARTGYTGEDGFELIVPVSRVESIWRALAAAGVKLCGLGARDTLRLEAGMNLYGQDMDESTSPLAAGLGWTVDLASARDFVGKAALSTQSCSQQLAGLLLLDRGGVLRAHQSVATGHGDGEITSGTFSPTLGQSIALARLPASATVGEHVHVEIRDKKLAARIVKPPFVRNGKVLVS